MAALCMDCWGASHWVVTTGFLPGTKASSKQAATSNPGRGSSWHAESGVGSATNLLVPQREQHSLALLISRHTKCGQGRQALTVYHDVRNRGVQLSSEIFVAALKACKSLQDLESARQIHGHVVESGLDSDAEVATALVRLYVNCGSLADARLAFEKVKHHDVELWNAIILGYAHMDQGDMALQLYAHMQKSGVVANCQTYVAALKACSSLAASKDRNCKSGIDVAVRQRCLDHIRSIHSQSVDRGLECDVSLGNMLIDAYCKCGSLLDARRVFEKIPRRTVVSWTAMISGYAQMQEADVALQLYARMRQEGVVPDDRTFVSALKACSCLAVLSGSVKSEGRMPVRERCLGQVRAIHSHVLKRGYESNVFVGTMLVDVYAKCGSLLDARSIFDRMLYRNVVSWNAMILGYVQMEEGAKALQLFAQMQQEGVTPDDRTFVGALKACSSLVSLKEGSEVDVNLAKTWCLEKVRSIHSCLVDRKAQPDVFVDTMLVDVYAKCGSLVDARCVFESMPHRNVVSWSAMILGYTQVGEGESALELFTRMQQEGVVPDDQAYVGALKACGVVAGLDKGKEVHAQIAKNGLDTFPFVCTSLIDMYCKCGSMENAQLVFDELRSKDVVTWNALIAGYAHQGQTTLVFQLFENMKKEGIQPDSITLLSILTACSHAGLVDKGQKCFEDIRKEYGINPTRDHCTCMIDLLGRAGLVDRAMMLVETMPFQPDSAVWQTVLGACRKWSNVELGRVAFEHAVRLDKRDPAAYVLMSNIYESAHMWDDAMDIQSMRVKTQALKQPGQSQWTDVSGNVHAFAAGDMHHPESLDIYVTLRNLSGEMTKERSAEQYASESQRLPNVGSTGPKSAQSKKMIIAYDQLKRTQGTATSVCVRLFCKSVEPAEVYELALLRATLPGIPIRHQQGLLNYTKGLTAWKHWGHSQVRRKAGQACIWETPSWVAKLFKRRISFMNDRGGRFVCRSCSHGQPKTENNVYRKPLPKDEFYWTALVSQQIKCGKNRQALQVFKEMREGGIKPSSFTFVTVLKACRNLKDLGRAKCIYSEAVKDGFGFDLFVGNMLIDVYAKCGSLVDARAFFEKMRDRNVISWNTMILAYAQKEEGEVALQLFSRMRSEGVEPNDRTFVAALKACSNLAGLKQENETDKVVLTNKCLAEVRTIHSLVVQSKFESDLFVATTLVDSYAKFGSLVDARQVFEKMPRRSAVAWTAIIMGYAETEQGEIGLQLYERMKQEGVVPDAQVFVGALKACCRMAAGEEHNHTDEFSVKEKCLEQARAIHAEVVKLNFDSDVFVGNMLVDVYSKCGSKVDARTVFDRMRTRNVVTWNTMISGYAHMGEGEVGLLLYEEMKKQQVVPNERTFLGALKACSSLAALKEGTAVNRCVATKRCLEQVKIIHSHIVRSGIKLDVFLGTTLVDLYAKCGSMVDAMCLFKMLPYRNVVSWTTMILGYVQTEDGEAALQLYSEMRNKGVVPDAQAFVGALKACCNLAAFGQAKSDDMTSRNRCLEHIRVIHEDVVKSKMETDIFVANMLVDVYVKCGSLAEGRHVFERMTDRNVVSWSTMISGYANMDEGEAALYLYTRMQEEGVVPNDRTFMAALKACSVATAIDMGRKLHAQISETFDEATNLYVASSLIDMYGKCGSMVEAQQVFDVLCTPDAVAWNALIAGYARQGESELVFDLFEQMKQAGNQPEISTFLSILRVCSSSGLLTKGQEYFEAMSKVYGISPTVEHYACMVDLLARAGQVEKAMVMIDSSPHQPDCSLWKIVLSACQTWCNVELGQQAFDRAISLDQSDAALYVLMSNIYAAVDMWEQALEMRTRIATLGVWKQPGQSWFSDICGTMHEFLAGDSRYFESSYLISRLQDLTCKMED